MEIRAIASKIEDLKTGVWALSGLILAVYDAAFHGTFAAQDYDGAMYGVLAMSQNLEKETDNVVEAIYEVIQKESK